MGYKVWYTGTFFHGFYKMHWSMSSCEFMVSNDTGNSEWENCISLDFYFRGLSGPWNPWKIRTPRLIMISQNMGFHFRQVSLFVNIRKDFFFFFFFLPFFHWILELFRQCGIFCFSFKNSFIYNRKGHFQ